MNNIIIDNAKVMSKGQITLPKDIRVALGLGTGDRVTFICEDNKVILMNSAVYAMQMLQDGMKGEDERTGLISDDDINDLISQIRSEVEED